MRIQCRAIADRNEGPFALVLTGAPCPLTDNTNGTVFCPSKWRVVASKGPIFSIRHVNGTFSVAFVCAKGVAGHSKSVWTTVRVVYTFNMRGREAAVIKFAQGIESSSHL